MPPQNQQGPLPRGISTKAENIFIRLAQELFEITSDMTWDQDPNQSDVSVLSEDSDADLARLPQVRVGCGDVSDWKGSLNRLQDWDVNVSMHQITVQGYVMFSCYAANFVEARDMADHLRMALLRAKPELGRLGIFALRSLQTTKPKEIQPSGTDGAMYMASTTSAFMAIEGKAFRNVSTEVWEGFNVSLETTVAPIDQNGPVVETATRKLKVVNLYFNEKVGPFMPAGFTVEVDGSLLPAVPRRSTSNYKQVQLTLDDVIPRDALVVVRYDPGTLSAFEGDIPAEAFEVEPELTL